MTETAPKNQLPMRLPVVDPSKCDGCDQCIKVCPHAAIYQPGEVTCSKCIKYCLTMEVPCRHDHVAFSYGACDSCGICVAACTRGALIWTGREAAMARQSPMPDGGDTAVEDNP
jgi:ferredoxin